MKTHMKRLVFRLCCTVVFLLAGGCGKVTPEAQGGVSSNAVDTVRQRVQAGITTIHIPRKSVIQFTMQPLETNMTVRIGESTVRVPVRGHLVFIDEAPEMDWAHKAQFIVVPTVPDEKTVTLFRGDIIPNIRIMDAQGNTMALSWLKL